MRVMYHSQRIEFSTGYCIDAAKWDADRQQIQIGSLDRKANPQRYRLSSGAVLDRLPNFRGANRKGRTRTPM